MGGGGEGREEEEVVVVVVVYVRVYDSIFKCTTYKIPFRYEGHCYIPLTLYISLIVDIVILQFYT